MGSNLPETETEVYYEFTLQTLIRTLQKSGQDLDADVNLERFEDLGEEKRCIFLNICKLALRATEAKLFCAIIPTLFPCFADLLSLHLIAF